MSRNWESKFSTWALGPANTEQERCENSIRAIRRALNNDDILNSKNTEVFLQGSYRNRVNIRKDSDVDVGIICYETFYYNLNNGVSSEDAGILPSTYPYSDFKNDVHRALNNYFGEYNVTRGNKAFDIKANSYRVEADVAPFFEYRDYWERNNYRKGVKLTPDSGGEIINYPEQHYDNGVSKNTLTSRRYKRNVRILKHLKAEMEGAGYSSATKVPGFLLECLVFDVPNSKFMDNSLYQQVRLVLTHLFNNTLPSVNTSEWLEVNEIKYLFHATQPWTQQEAHSFISDAWDYIGYIN